LQATLSGSVSEQLGDLNAIGIRGTRRRVPLILHLARPAAPSCSSLTSVRRTDFAARQLR
jgi:hypothetical protein